MLQIQHDHYWHLPVEASFDLEAEPSEFTAGQISDDLKEVRNMLARGDAGPAWHELSHVLGLLRVVEAAARQ
ncbi:hypothetical protein EON77_08700 [bacterium]|nr:MAG: hypothetical protein EON77_08700 [bacterium]